MTSRWRAWEASAALEMMTRCCVVLCHVVLCCVVLCHIISYHIISYHIISYHIISYHIISHHVTLSYPRHLQYYQQRLDGQNLEGNLLPSSSPPYPVDPISSPESVRAPHTIQDERK